MANVVDSLRLLFDRPNEPVFSPKGDENAVFQLSETHLWGPHIANLADRLSSAAYAVKKIREISDEDTARLVYFSYFHSIMSYGILLWGNAADINTIFVLQKRAIRSIYKMSCLESLRDKFKEIGILTVASQYILDNVLYVRKNLNNFKKKSDNHCRNTTNKNKLEIPVIRLSKSDNYQNNGIEINNRFGEKADMLIPLNKLKKVPKFTKAKRLPMDVDFSILLPAHREMADEVIDELLGVPEGQLQDFLSLCVYARANLNPQLFNYCYSVSLMHRKDTENVPIQNFAETFPSKFVDSQVFAQARETAAVAAAGAPRTPIIIPRDFTATDLDVEHRLAYWREDIGINLHHWHWHLVYPFTSNQRRIVAKDRRGELFYYMHQQMIARYNGERLNNALPRVKKFNNFTEPIPEAYFPKLDSLTSSRGWPPRQANMTWSDVNRPVDGVTITIADMNRWRRNIEDAISSGFVKLPDGSQQPLDIDLLGNIFESSILSPNREFYGDLHNQGHNITGYIHDPTNRYLESFNVMADEATNMRDPIFYRWHAFVDDIFHKFKESAAVRPYTQSELENPGVQISSVKIESSTGQANTLNTFWMMSDVDLSRGLDFSNRGPVYVRFTHLNHRPFQYVIDVNNTGSARRATCRIFLAPKFDERNIAWEFADQRKMFIEMDRFIVPLNAGNNKITRKSTESVVTIPFEQTFRDLSIQGSTPRRDDLASFNFCGCGWPQHMLVPRGTEAGAQYELFVMLSNYELDRIEQTNSPALSCVEASSFCGLKDRLYPDKRAMGYPFDRPSRSVRSVRDFILPNMSLIDVTIRLQNVTEPNPKNPKQ